MNLQVASIPNRVIAPATAQDKPHVELRNVSLVYGAGDEQTLAVDRVTLQVA
ncbi:MAG: hypothetical protein QOI40_5124, partial [Alphaproteobacteria bacterium]|nr:hypothetical protein [Alphaproteobacteria bacterium]